jgi:hypothetical protein
MSLGGVSLGVDFPRFAREFEIIRLDDQGLAAYKKITVTLSGFLNDWNGARVQALYNTLKNAVGYNDTTFTYTATDALNEDQVITTYNDQKVWIASYQEPDDAEFGKNATGDYSITFYYFEDATSNTELVCSYGTYTFEKTPKIGRKINPNRGTHRAKLTGSTVEVTLEGVLFASDTASLQAKINAMTVAFSQDANLTYGSYSQPCRVGPVVITPITLINYAPFTITLFYDVGPTIELHRRITISRIHQNPVITEEPFCDRRVIELMNISGQTINYNIKVTSSDLATCRQQLATEVLLLLFPGGVELEGGSEVWDYDEVSVDVNFTKFYTVPVMDNLDGTGF